MLLLKSESSLLGDIGYKPAPHQINRHILLRHNDKLTSNIIFSDSVIQPPDHSTATMNAAAQGAAALDANDYPSAITHYTTAISSNPQAVDYYIKRSMAYARMNPFDYDSALRDAEIAVVLATKRGKRELIAESQLRRGIALNGLQRWGDAQLCFSWSSKFNPEDKVLKIWKTKVDAKMKGLEAGDEKGKAVVKEVPEIELPTAAKDVKSATNGAAITPTPSPQGGAEKKSEEEASFVASKTRYDWYQTADNVVVTLFAKGIPKDKVKIDFHPNSLNLSFPTSSDSDFEYNLENLYADIDPSSSKSKVLSTKIEITLQKAHRGNKWPSLECNPAPELHSSSSPSQATTNQTPSTSKTNPPLPTPKPTAPVYPTSSKTGPKDWDKLADSFAKKPKPEHTTPSSSQANNNDDDDEGIDYETEGGDEVNAFFKQIYKSASPDARRAMMKSYQESNGTALSTNWDEVGKGKVETVPPAGMEERSWGK